jgi:hypothetical protein
MKRAVWIVAVVALCVGGTAAAQDRSGLIGSGTRSGDSGQVLGSGSAASQTMGSGLATPSPDSGQVIGSGYASGQTMGSGGFTASSHDSGQILGSGGRSDNSGQVVGSGYLRSGVSVVEVRLLDGSSLLVVSFVPIAE